MMMGPASGRDDMLEWKGCFGSLPSARRFRNRLEEINKCTRCSAIRLKQLAQPFGLADTVQSIEYAAARGPERGAELVARGGAIASGGIRKKMAPTSEGVVPNIDREFSEEFARPSSSIFNASASVAMDRDLQISWT
jgi:hypothetical protein